MKKINAKAFLLLLTFVCIAQILFSQDVMLVDVNPTNRPKGKLMLGDLVENVEYIPLETNDNCLIGVVTRYDVSKNYILVYCGKSKSVYLFRRNGDFVRQISSLGQGPEEYIGIYDVFIDENKNELILCTHLKQLFFNISGKFLRKADFLLNQTPLWIYYNNQFLSGTPSGIFLYAYPVYNTWTAEMQKIGSFVQSVRVEHGFEKGAIMTASPPIAKYIYQDKPHVRESTLNDTVYVVSDSSLISKFVLSTGRYGITAEEKATFNMELLEKSPNIVSVAETGAYILFQYKYKKTIYCAYYIKKSSKLEYFDTNNEGIPNNYDGGFDFWPNKQVNNEWYCFYDAPTFLTKFSAQKPLSPIISQTLSQKFKSLFKKIDPEDNPILVIAKVKM